MKPKIKYLYILTDRGFGSEINNLLYAINYSNKKKYEFILESSIWNFKFKNGWNDYFYSLKIDNFSVSFRIRLLKLFISSIGKNYTNLHFNWDSSSLPIKQKIFKIVICLIKGRYIITSFETFSDLRRFTVEEIVSNMNPFKISINKILIKIWQLRLENFDSFKKTKIIGNDYIVMHIRRGDKISSGEDILYTVQDYIDVMLNLNTSTNTIFLMSDDFGTFLEIKEKLPNYTIFTIADSERNGHIQSDFNELSISSRKNEMISLLTEIEIARNCRFFIGSHRSNLYRLIEYFKLNNCYSVSQSTLIDP
ncbi:hypothetical protein KBJ98_06755 [Flavobacterium sp. F-328]|uniref:Glycosyl transferase family 11 n=1 Tax=Flavobacterium erciyesense TaxID=2825842 RepID=A0ABS5D2Z1_9FLAO|nr:hypothetical protein [Flavobacterium erciyesense]MBQ0908397.1 hypothetical protein [Flavobacterium erciyesense]